MNSAIQNQSNLPACGCTPQIPTNQNDSNVYALPLARLDKAREQLEGLLSSKLGRKKCKLEDSSMHCFDQGFGVSKWVITSNQLLFAAVGVVDKVPTQVTLNFDTSFFDTPGRGENRDVFWVELEIIEPIPRKLSVPFRGVGVLRDPSNNNLMRCDSFELAVDLIADAKDVVKTIACVLACVGLFCAAVCAPLCVAIIACIACLASCVGANLPAFLRCVSVCGIVTDGLEDVLT